jgi:FkbM family methyltransferase
MGMDSGRLPPRWLCRALFRVRPYTAAEALKFALGIRRQYWTAPNGLNLWLDPVSNLARFLWLGQGVYEIETTRLIRGSLTPGGVFVDVGTNEGWFSLIAARCVGPSGRVVAIEPQRRLLPVLYENMALNKFGDRVLLRSVALGETEGIGELHLAPDLNTGASSLQRHLRYETVRERVRVMRLDALLEEADIGSVDLLKLDCEGAEEGVLRGAGDYIAQRRIKRLLVEFHPHISGRKSCKAAHQLLLDAGYVLQRETGTKATPKRRLFLYVA